MASEREDAASREPTGRSPDRRSLVRRRLLPMVRGVGFWAAIVLPWIALGLLFTGIATEEPGLFTGIVLGNLVAAVVGGEYEGARL